MLAERRNTGGNIDRIPTNLSVDLSGHRGCNRRNIHEISVVSSVRYELMAHWAKDTMRQVEEGHIECGEFIQNRKILA